MELGIIILAAGQGTRMRSTLPKVLHPLAGRPLLGHVLAAARALGPQLSLVVFGHGGDQVPRAFAAADAIWVEQAEQRGTGHAVAQALPWLPPLDKVLILYGDVPLIRPETLTRLLAATADAPLAVLTVELADPTGYGRMVRDPDGRLLRIVEHHDATAEELEIQEINTGILAIDYNRLRVWVDRIGDRNAQGEYYLTDIIRFAVEEGVQVASVQPSALEEVLGVNDRVQLARLERFYQGQQAERLLAAGVALADPARFDLRGRLDAGQDVSIDINVLFEGEVTLGDGVSIGPHCVIRDSRIGAGTRVDAYSLIEGAEIGAEARIGPFARIRSETRIADRVHIGNFVELKKSEVAAGSKINHLSYVGDCTVGAEVNVGAGTITCNYDGANKHRTQIGDRAFIGSNTALVAPVTVGAGATVGAGSVIIRDVPDKALGVARGRQQLIPDWRRPAKKTPPG